MTSIAVTSTAYQVEKRGWLVQQLADAESVTLDVSAFTKATHYPNGYIPSGVVLGKITATGLYAPYVDAASDGTGTAAGYLHSSVAIPNPADTTVDVGAAMVAAFAVVETDRLPISSGATGGGFIDANGQANLTLIRHI